MNTIHSYNETFLKVYGWIYLTYNIFVKCKTKPRYYFLFDGDPIVIMYILYKIRDKWNIDNIKNLLCILFKLSYFVHLYIEIYFENPDDRFKLSRSQSRSSVYTVQNFSTVTWKW